MSIIIFLFGIVLGSFLNVCIYRIPLNQSIAYPPSHCTKCGKSIKWYDNIPLLSYIFLKGKCRYCKDKISIKYPMIEFLTGILFVLLYKTYGINLYFIKYCIFVCLLLVIAFIDLNSEEVYTSVTITGIILGIIIIFLQKKLLYNQIFDYIIGLLISASFIALIVYTTKGMGEGDVEIAALSGVFLGWKLAILMIMLSFIIGAAISLFLIMFKIKNRKDTIPFGPFIALSSIICILYGNNIINWYVNTFLI